MLENVLTERHSSATKGCTGSMPVSRPLRLQSAEIANTGNSYIVSAGGVALNIKGAEVR